MTEPPPPPPAPAPTIVEAAPGPAPSITTEQRADGTLVIDLTGLAPPQPPPDCAARAPDPFNPEIVVCAETGPSPRLGPVVGPVDEGFASAIPRARLRLSDKATAEANLVGAPVGGFDAEAAEVRLKIDF